MPTIDERVRALGRRQRGLATRAQVLEAGVSAASITRRLQSGVWRQPFRGVIDLGTHVDGWHRDAQLALLVLGPSAFVSHASAAHLHGLLDVAQPDGVDITTDRQRRGAVKRQGIRHRTTREIAAPDLCIVDGLRVSSVARTLWDLAALTPLDQLERLAWDLGRRGAREALVGAARLAAEHPQAPGSAKLRAALLGVPRGAHLLGSVLEADGVRRLTAVGLAPPALQFVIRDPAGRYVRRVDAAWPDRLVAVEFDGAAYHDTASARVEDAATRQRIAALGWSLVVVRARDLHGARFDRVVAELRDLVSASARS